MRSFILGLLVAMGVAFLLLMPVRTMRMQMSDGPARISFDDGPRAGRTATIVRSSKRRASDHGVQELKVVGPARDTEEQAYDDAFQRAAEAVQEYFGLRTELHPDDMKQIIRDQPTKTIVPLGMDKKTGKDLGDAVQVELNLRMNNEFVEQLAHFERESRMSQRMQMLARSLACLVAGLFAIAGYVRLDEWSKGYYSGLLKAVAVIAVVGTGFAVWFQ